MNVPKLLSLGIVAALVVLTGCASIVSKSEWPVNFKSDPAGAEVVIRDYTGIEIDKGITPATFTLKSSSGFFSGATYYAEFRLNDYQVAKTSLHTDVNGWYWGNILLCEFGLIGGLIVDPATGAMYKLLEQCSVKLNKLESSGLQLQKDAPAATNNAPTELNTASSPAK